MYSVSLDDAGLAESVSDLTGPTAASEQLLAPVPSLPLTEAAVAGRCSVTDWQVGDSVLRVACVCWQVGDSVLCFACV